ncbi:Helix-turn-helix domain containing protein [uncultured Caudovirales phage]|uniref:Helix-turn-helix domain containing protein n=1 Tax=uncultured Caudovirales phage TaxID=2100421 RepID=A0A6J5KRP3_9CAUD|nr:Helix-turn-helix domain containing protein [uncultured Caudovirales phage]
MPTPQKEDSLRTDFGLMSQDDLSALLSLTKETLREWRRLKQGPSFVRIGKGVFYRRQDVQDWINGNVVAAKALNG